MQDYSSVDLILYSNGDKVGELTPDYIGVLGIHVTHSDESLFQINQHYEMVIKEKSGDGHGFQSVELPVVLIAADKGGHCVKLRDYDSHSLDCWMSALNWLISRDSELGI